MKRDNAPFHLNGFMRIRETIFLISKLQSFKEFYRNRILRLNKQQRSSCNYFNTCLVLFFPFVRTCWTYPRVSGFPGQIHTGIMEPLNIAIFVIASDHIAERYPFAKAINRFVWVHLLLCGSRARTVLSLFTGATSNSY